MFEGKHTFIAESFLTKLKAAYETYAVLPEDWVKLAKTRLGGVAASFETELAAENNAENAFSALFPIFERKLLARFLAAPEDAGSFVLVYINNSCRAPTSQNTYRISISRSAELALARWACSRCCKRYS